MSFGHHLMVGGWRTHSCVRREYALRSDSGVQDANRHAWKLVAAVGVALMAYACADDARVNEAEFVRVGCGRRDRGRPVLA